jgi:hypothetical protein
MRGQFPRECPICGFSGFFRSDGFPPKFDHTCPRCESGPRQRFMFLFFTEHLDLANYKNFLHFAPESCLSRALRARAPNYLTADIDMPGADLQLDIENIELEDSYADLILCSHVLEHVDDHKAMRELFRILRPGGALVVLVPFVAGWTNSYENSAIVKPQERLLHFGQEDHVRYYGQDLVSRLKDAGFSVERVTNTPAEVIKYGLSRGEQIFLCRKPA